MAFNNRFSQKRNPSCDNNGQEGQQKSQFLQRIHEAFPKREAQQIILAYSCLVKHSGETPAEHLRPAEILLEYHADYPAILSALLLPLRHNGFLSHHDILERFGKVPANLVEHVYLEDVLRTDTEEHRHDDVQRLLLSFSDDLHVIILRLGLRLTQLESFAANGSVEHRGIVRETLEMYVPLADRMGLGKLKAQLEDISFRLLEPSIYTELEKKLKPIQAEDALCLELVEEGVQRLLSRNGVKSTIHGRAKSLYSLYRKMCRQQRSLETIMDRIGLRIIVMSVQECYHVLRLIHTHFRPIPGTFDDYIGSS